MARQMARKIAKAPRTIYLLRQTQLLVYAEMVESLKAFGLTPVQYMVLSSSSHEGGLSSADLARRAQMTPQSMNELIAALHRKGLVRRREHPDNKRILQVGLTKDGARLLAQCDRQIDRMEQELFRCFTEKELGMFRRLHSKMLHKILHVSGKLESSSKAA
jgi:DNA-binding MarR family transcriptional regulator